MKKIRLFSLVAMLCMVQSIMAQLTSLGLVEEGRCSIGHHKPIPKLEISDNFLYASTEKGLYRYELDGDEGWLQMPITDCPVTDFFVNGDTLIITTMEQLYVSYNGGINVDNVSVVLEAGVNVVVAGSAIFGGDIAGKTKAFLEKME